MSLFKKIKYAFGLSVDTDDPIIEDEPDIQLSSHQAQEPVTEAVIAEIKVEDDTHPQLIFEHVVATFNEALPEFLQKSVDPEAQRRALFDSLDADLKGYIELVRTRAEEQCQKHFAEEKNKLHANIREMENRYRDYEDKRNELTAKQLSAERQRRALNERVKDLETHIAELEAEREQLQLENKSLINKVKVAGVFEKESGELAEDIKKLQAENNRLRQLYANGDDGAGKKAFDELKKECEQKDAELREAKEALEMAVTEAREAKEQLENIQSEAPESAHAENDEEKAEMEQQLRLIEEQVAKFEEISTKKDQKIAALKNQLENSETESAATKEQLAKIEAERTRLTSSLEEASRKIAAMERVQTQNLEMQMRGEKKLRDEVNALKSALEQRRHEITALQKKLEKAHVTRDKNSARSKTWPESQNVTPIEDILSETDWVVNPNSIKNKDNKDTGHSERGRRQNGENDSQLSLF